MSESGLDGMKLGVLGEESENTTWSASHVRSVWIPMEGIERDLSSEVRRGRP